MNKEEYIKLYKEIRKEVEDSEVSIEILKQIALDLRTEVINEYKQEAKKESAILPASKKQMDYLKTLSEQGFVNEKIPENLTKNEASKIIEEAIKKSENLFKDSEASDY